MTLARTAARLTGAALITLALPAASAAAPGDPDPAWGTNGVVATDFPQTQNEAVTAVVPELAGHALALGSGTTAGGGTLLLAARYDDSGKLDPSFGQGGMAAIALPGVQSFAPRQGALAGDGSVLVTGFGRASGGVPVLWVARLTTAGRLDSSFGSGGVRVIVLGAAGVGGSSAGLAVQGDGASSTSAIYLAGNVADSSGSLNQIVLHRIGANGADASFSSAGGSAEIRLPFGSDVAGGVTFVSNQIAVGAGSSSSTQHGFATYRFSSSGFSLGRTFAPVAAAGTDPVDLEDVFVQHDGRVLLGGGVVTTVPGHATPGLIQRYSTNGSLDASFGSGGTRVVPALTFRPRWAVLDDALYGYSGTAVAGLNPDGSTNSGFGVGGQATVTYPSGHGSSRVLAGQLRSVGSSPAPRLYAAGSDGAAGASTRFFVERLVVACSVFGSGCQFTITPSPAGGFTIATTSSRSISMGILVDRILRFRRVNGVRVPVARNIGRVPFGPQHRGKVRIHWDGTVNGHPLRPGRYRITLRALKDVKHIVETARPDVLRIAR